MAKVLVCDLVGLRFDAEGRPDHSEIRDYVLEKGGLFHTGRYTESGALHQPDKINFYYQPDLATEDDLLGAAADGVYDAIIVAATIVPEGAQFAKGGVRIGAGTDNMRSQSWGGPRGRGGKAPLMNTPGTNSRATAQMVMKAVLSALPRLPVDELHEHILRGEFDTGRDIRQFPTAKLEGMRMAILGFGKIGCEVAALALAFHMEVVVYARPAHRSRIEAAGYTYAESPLAAAAGAHILSVHVGLGPLDPASGIHANAGMVDARVLSAMQPGAVLLNYDRGEVVDVGALDSAMTAFHVADAFIDADIFRDRTTGEVTGPLAPYVEPARRLGGRLRLLPHVAADTDHPSRVTGAICAVDQIIDAILHKRVRYLVGDLPDGYALAR
ncbi:NAD(P)-dependent oxidoreductase [Mesorhizobium sp. A623]